MTDPLPYDEEGNRARVRALRANGVTVWSPERVFVGEEVRLDRIEPGAVLMNAVLRGETTAIGSGSQIGGQGSATITDCQIGRAVEIGPGSYAGCVLLDRVRIRGFAELRGGTVLEEQAELAHNVGLKNSFLGAAVVAGSCVNFCDVYMTGGTSRADHSEIGSGAVHFNFSPRRDKFASLFGDSTGLLLRSAPVFLGGNTGLVAPLTLPFGALVPAGVTLRTWPADVAADSSPAAAHVRKSLAALRFIAVLQATRSWYAQVRSEAGDVFDRALYRAAHHQLGVHLTFRQRELERFITRIASRGSDPALAQFGQSILRIAGADLVPTPPPETFLAAYVASRRTNAHIESLAGLAAETVVQAQDWLTTLEEQYTSPAKRAAEQWSSPSN